jgi:hypothetical protein
MALFSCQPGDGEIGAAAIKELGFVLICTYLSIPRLAGK